ncbi:hypothetical protein Pmani_032876 [Petrolisthes manimaculis]|uniref:Uncharacterized protein n=1 Tax=Petrolisthes manimaculis TaxID=1843537 RepID=A0AAE1NS42_9EUCA|nr:hypothetical protein Pmani_032876 [Petrolisthes manimaculis]
MTNKIARTGAEGEIVQVLLANVLDIDDDIRQIHAMTTTDYSRYYWYTLFTTVGILASLGRSYEEGGPLSLLTLPSASTTKP